MMELADTSGLTARLKQCVKAQAEIPKGENYNEEFYTIDNLFHGSLLEAVGKPNVMSLISEPYIHVRRWRNYEIRSAQRMKEIVGEHRQLIEAIEKKDARAGREYLHLHLDTVARYSKPLKEKEAQYFC